MVGWRYIYFRSSLLSSCWMWNAARHWGWQNQSQPECKMWTCTDQFTCCRMYSMAGRALRFEKNSHGWGKWWCPGSDPCSHWRRTRKGIGVCTQARVGVWDLGKATGWGSNLTTAIDPLPIECCWYVICPADFKLRIQTNTCLVNSPTSQQCCMWLLTLPCSACLQGWWESGDKSYVSGWMSSCLKMLGPFAGERASLSFCIIDADSPQDRTTGDHTLWWFPHSAALQQRPQQPQLLEQCEWKQPSLISKCMQALFLWGVSVPTWAGWV